MTEVSVASTRPKQCWNWEGFGNNSHTGGEPAFLPVKMDWGQNPSTIPVSWSCRGPGERKDLIFPSTSTCDSVNEDMPRVSGKQRISVVWCPEVFWHNFGVCTMRRDPLPAGPGTTRTDLNPFSISAGNGLGWILEGEQGGGRRPASRKLGAWF